jgi:hypothetical protein
MAGKSCAGELVDLIIGGKQLKSVHVNRFSFLRLIFPSDFDYNMRYILITSGLLKLLVMATGVSSYLLYFFQIIRFVQVGPGNTAVYIFVVANLIAS